MRTSFKCDKHAVHEFGTAKRRKIKPSVIAQIAPRSSKDRCKRVKEPRESLRRPQRSGCANCSNSKRPAGVISYVEPGKIGPRLCVWCISPLWSLNRSWLQETSSVTSMCYPFRVQDDSENRAPIAFSKRVGHKWK